MTSDPTFTLDVQGGSASDPDYVNRCVKYAIDTLWNKDKDHFPTSDLEKRINSMLLRYVAVVESDSTDHRANRVRIRLHPNARFVEPQPVEDEDPPQVPSPVLTVIKR